MSNKPKAIRKGAVVRYIRKNELATGQTFTVKKKEGALIEVAFPVKYLDGSIHLSHIFLPIRDFELV